MNAGDTIAYDDGRSGHQVKASVLEINDDSMIVQFEDRAQSTLIRFDDARWMAHIRKIAK